MEFDQEIKMKQKWINSRMQMLHKLLPKQTNSNTQAQLKKFMTSIQPEYPKKVQISYERPGMEGRAIPMPMDSGEPIAMRQADVYEEPIQMQAQSEEVKKDAE